MGSNHKDYMSDVPVILVGNKTDQTGDRMVGLEEGQRRFKELSCACFHEISVRESVDQVRDFNRLLFFFLIRIKCFSSLKYFPGSSSIP